MKYLLDFDHTLMDTEALKIAVAKEGRLSLVGTPELWNYHSITEFLFLDVLPWLATKPKDSLHILTAFKPSQGPEAKAFQTAKIASDNFSDLFASVTVIEGLKGEPAVEIAKQFLPHEQVVFIDDRLDQCCAVAAALPSAWCFLMRRNNDVPEGVPAGIRVVSSLAEVDDSINKL